MHQQQANVSSASRTSQRRVQQRVQPQRVARDMTLAKQIAGETRTARAKRSRRAVPLAPNGAKRRRAAQYLRESRLAHLQQRRLVLVLDLDETLVHSLRGSVRQIGKGKKDQVFPPAPQPSKIDMQIESGEYFLSQEAKRRRAAQEKLDKQKEALGKTQEAADKIVGEATKAADKLTAEAAKRSDKLLKEADKAAVRAARRQKPHLIAAAAVRRSGRHAEQRPQSPPERVPCG